MSAKKKRQRSEKGVLACQTEEAWMALLGESQLEPKPEKSLGIDQQFFKCL
jgi:hypothetical protein